MGKEIDCLSDRKKRGDLTLSFAKGIKVRRDKARRQHKGSQASREGNWREEME